eukprot:COSAG03_NODE_9962_length_681_cov_8.608247_1_plen_20_part_10
MFVISFPVLLSIVAGYEDWC